MLRLAAAPMASLAVSVPIGFKVCAAEGEAPKNDPPAPKSSDKYKPSQLPIYGDPPKTEYDFIPEEKTAFMSGVTSVRKSLWNFMDTFQDTTDKVNDKMGVAQAHSLDLLHYIQEDAGVLPKAIIITVAGLGGIVAGYRGRYVKKGIYAGIGMVTAASICYPHQAVDISQYGWSKFKRDALGMKVQKPSQILEKTEPSKDQVTMSKDAESAANTITDAKVQKDFGQSKPEDKDMYTTRGS